MILCGLPSPSLLLPPLGAVTPPVGATTYVVAGIAGDIPLKEVFKGVTLFLPAYILTILLLILFPALVTFLPGLWDNKKKGFQR